MVRIRLGISPTGAGFLTIFLGNDRTAPPVLTLWLARWLLFRVEFGAGLIKLRGDSCWRDLTCLYYHHETQPMPGPLSWLFHNLPRPLHRIEVVANHVAQLVVPFALFAPQPVASLAAAAVVVTQLWLVLSGNFAWLNWLTIILACAAIDNSAAAALFPLPARPALPGPPLWFAISVIAFAVLVAYLSYRPVRNLVSRRQRMNQSFNPFHLVNTYGAFGSIGRTRDEVVFEGIERPRSPTKPLGRNTNSRANPVIRESPTSMGPLPSPPGLAALVRRRLTALRARMAGLLRRAAARQRPRHAETAPPQSFRRSPPRHVRALLYRYRFTTPAELWHTRAWWHRTLIGEYLPPVTIRSIMQDRGAG